MDPQTDERPARSTIQIIGERRRSMTIRKAARSGPGGGRARGRAMQQHAPVLQLHVDGTGQQLQALLPGKRPAGRPRGGQRQEEQLPQCSPAEPLAAVRGGEQGQPQPVLICATSAAVHPVHPLGMTPHDGKQQVRGSFGLPAGRVQYT